MTDYVELAESEGYDEEFLSDMGEALDYGAFWLKLRPRTQPHQRRAQRWL